jgi:hypothetical protein
MTRIKARTLRLVPSLGIGSVRLGVEGRACESVSYERFSLSLFFLPDQLAMLFLSHLDIPWLFPGKFSRAI